MNKVNNDDSNKTKDNKNIESEKFDLYIGGGGIRSGFAAGVICALYHKGMHHNINKLICSSAGAYIGAYLLADIPIIGTIGYWKGLAPRVNEHRKISWPTINIKKTVNEFLFHYNKIDLNKVINSEYNKKGNYIITCLNAESGKHIYLSHFKSIDILLQAFYGSSHIPVFAGIKPYLIEKKYLKQCRIFDENFNEIFPEFLEVFDGTTSNFFTEKNNISSRSQLQIRIINHNLFRNHIKSLPLPAPIEKIIAHLLFKKYPNATRVYTSYHTVSYSKQVLKNIIKVSSRAKVQFIYHHNICSISVFKARNCTYVQKIIQQDVLDGWNLFYEEMGIKPEPYPKEWENEFV